MFNALCINQNEKLEITKNNTLFLIYLILLFNFFVPTESRVVSKPVQNNLGRPNFLQKANTIKPTITKFNKQFIFDTNYRSCDIFIKERIEFQYTNPTDVIHHLIISKKNPLYGFAVNLPINSSLSIKKIEIFQDKSLRNRFYENKNHKSVRMFFRDRWLISVLLDKKVKRVILNYSYYTQRAVLIDPDNNKNVIKLYVINPYPYNLKNLNIQLLLLNFKHLKEKDLTIPAFSKLKQVNIDNRQFKGKGFNISIDKNLPIHSEFFMQLALPMEIKSCETKLVYVIYYSLIAMTIGFALMSFSAVYFLYKE